MERHAVLVYKFDNCSPVGYDGNMRLGYRCRAYPTETQQQMLARTFGCVRVVWNRTLAARRARWQAEGKNTCYAQADRALTAMKRDPNLVSRVLRPGLPAQPRSWRVTW
jgi:hypothetical protein